MRRIVCGLIRGKYVKHQNQMLQAKNRDSPLWKAICKEMPFIMEGMGWSLGNDMSVSFWKDQWVDGSGPLIQHATSDIPTTDRYATVADMVTSDNKWDWDTFSQLIPVNVLIIITSIPAPRYEMDEDTVFWRNTTSGELSIRSAYELFDNSSGQLNMKDPI